MQTLSYSSYLYKICDPIWYKKQPNPLPLALTSADPKITSSLSNWYENMFNWYPRNWGTLRWSPPLAATLSRDPVTLQSIETVNVDGSGRHTFPKVFLEDDDPVGLAVFENSFFWANKLQLFRTSPHTIKEREVLLNASVSAFLVLHQSQQPKSKSHHLLSKHIWIRTHTKWKPPLNYYLHLLLELAILGPGKCSGYRSRRTQDFEQDKQNENICWKTCSRHIPGFYLT